MTTENGGRKSLTMGHAEDEDPFERLDQELEQGPWDPWVLECDGVGEGMESGFLDGGVGTGLGFEVTVENGEEVRSGGGGKAGRWGEKEG